MEFRRAQAILTLCFSAGGCESALRTFCLTSRYCARAIDFFRPHIDIASDERRSCNLCIRRLNDHRESKISGNESSYSLSRDDIFREIREYEEEDKLEVL